MEVSSVSFGAKYSKTPNGNYYKKKNTGKHIGTMVGLAGGITLAALPPAQLLSLSAAGKLFPKSMGKQLGATYQRSRCFVEGLAQFLIVQLIKNVYQKQIILHKFKTIIYCYYGMEKSYSISRL